MIQQRKIYRVPLIALGAVLGLCLIFFLLQFTHVTHFFQNSSQKAHEQETQYNRDNKAAVIQGNGNPSTTGKDGQPTPSTGTYTPPSDPDNISLVPTQQGNQVVITTKLNGYSDGTCVLTVTNGTASTKQSADVIYAPNFSTCAGFSVPISSIGKGSWTILLAVTSGGVTTTKTAGLEVQ